MNISTIGVNYPKGIQPCNSKKNPWYARLSGSGVYVISYHSTMEEAMLAYDGMVREHYGEFGRYHYPKKGERGMDGKIRR
jgi:hypothetical protein